MEECVSEKELKDQVIKEFESLQRIKNARDRDLEISYQEKILKARMQSLGIPTEELKIK